MKLVLKNTKIRLCKGLTSLEMACKCDNDFCRGTIISRKLVKAFGKFRELIGLKMRITSGFRCAPHNFAVGGKSLSRHTSGQAVDISLKSMDHLSNEEIDHAAKMSGFTYSKFYKSFVHLDVR